MGSIVAFGYQRFHRHTGPMKRLAIPLLLLFCTACSDAPPPPAFDVRTDMHDLMARVLDPAADTIWDSAGYIITAEGEEDLSPTTDEGWEAVAQSATQLMEAGNLLMLPGRSLGDDWDEYARGMIDASQLALEAAEAQDKDALFDAGGNIYQVCRACHNQYWVVIDDTDD